MNFDKCFAFLRFALSEETPLPDDISYDDWHDIFSFGRSQAITGLLFQGIKRLPSGVKPPEKLLMQWVMQSEQIRRQNIRVNTVAGEIFERFAADGFRCCILKGQGNALMYDDVYCRASGDVDIWMCGYADAQGDDGFVFPSVKEMTRRVVDYARKHFDVDIIRGHHACFQYKEIEIEAHFAASERANPLYGRRFDEWFRQHAREQSNHFVELPEGAGRIAVPTLMFNLVYQMSHLFRHFFDMGIGMRQFVDYWHLLRAFDASEPNKQHLRNDLRHLGLTSFAGAVMWVMRETLHVSTDKLFVEPDEQRGRLLLEEILNGGNFGKYDTKYGDITHKTMGGKYFMKTYRNLSFAKYYPEEAFFEPFLRTYQFFYCKAKGWR